jgi:hypothetical protein
MVDESGTWLSYGPRREGRPALLDVGHILRVGGSLWLETLYWLGVPCIASNATEAHALLLPLTRSEIALPLVVGGEPIGALDAQHTQESAFSEDDITALQAVADQLAVAINNARLLAELESGPCRIGAHQNLRGQSRRRPERAIHWVGNQAAPIPGASRGSWKMSHGIWLLANALWKTCRGVGRPLVRANAEAGVRAACFSGCGGAAMRAELQGLTAAALTKSSAWTSIFEDLRII